MEHPEPLVERLIREAIERGDLEPREGTGRPLDGLDRGYEPSWWARAWIEREGARLETLERDRAPRSEKDARGPSVGDPIREDRS